jgi:hypothetical protein
MIMMLKNITILSMLLAFMLGCNSNSNTNEEAERLRTETETTPISIGPKDATKSSTILLRTGDTEIDPGKTYWLVNGMKVEDFGGHRFTSGTLSKGDLVQAVAISGNNEFRSNELIISNSPPSIVKAKLAPEYPTADSTFTVNVEAKDNDNDFISYDYKWFVNDEYRGNDSFLDTELKRGDAVTVKISPTDREDTGKSVRLTSQVLNSLPVVSESVPVLEANIYKHRIEVSDPDGDQLTFTLQKGPVGMTIDQSGVLSWEIKSDTSGDHDIEVLINDSHGGEILLPISASISF